MEENIVYTYKNLIGVIVEKRNYTNDKGVIVNYDYCALRFALNDKYVDIQCKIDSKQKEVLKNLGVLELEPLK